MLFRPSGVGYVVSSDGMLARGRSAVGQGHSEAGAFLPANARWSSPIAVNTTLYAATRGSCGGAPSGVWAIDLDSDAKPVVSWKTNGGPVVGAVAFTSERHADRRDWPRPGELATARRTRSSRSTPRRCK